MSIYHPLFDKTSIYYDRYCKLISHASRNDGYRENHHIIPKSIGGTDDETNIVSLSLREHFIAHYLLTKFTRGYAAYKMLFAFDAMSLTPDQRNGGKRINSRLFTINKNRIRNTPIVWIQNTLSTKSRKIPIELYPDYYEQGWRIGKKRANTRYLVGRKKVYHDLVDKEKTITLEEYPDYYDQGWRIGSNPNSRKQLSKSVWVKANGETKRIAIEEYPSYYDQGWRIGRGTITEKKRMVVYHPMSKQKLSFIDEEKYADYYEQGWRMGRNPSKRKADTGKIWVTNIRTKKTMKMSRDEYASQTTQEWVKGRKINTGKGGI